MTAEIKIDFSVLEKGKKEKKKDREMKKKKKKREIGKRNDKEKERVTIACLMPVFV